MCKQSPLDYPNLLSLKDITTNCRMNNLTLNVSPCKRLVIISPRAIWSPPPLLGNFQFIWSTLCKYHTTHHVCRSFGFGDTWSQPSSTSSLLVEFHMFTHVLLNAPAPAPPPLQIKLPSYPLPRCLSVSTISFPFQFLGSVSIIGKYLSILVAGVVLITSFATSNQETLENFGAHDYNVAINRKKVSFGIC